MRQKTRQSDLRPAAAPHTRPDLLVVIIVPIFARLSLAPHVTVTPVHHHHHLLLLLPLLLLRHFRRVAVCPSGCLRPLPVKIQVRYLVVLGLSTAFLLIAVGPRVLTTTTSTIVLFFFPQPAPPQPKPRQRQLSRSRFPRRPPCAPFPPLHPHPPLS